MKKPWRIYNSGIYFYLIEYLCIVFLLFFSFSLFGYLFFNDSYVFLYIFNLVGFKLIPFGLIIFSFCVFNSHYIKITKSSHNIKIFSRNRFLRKKIYIKIPIKAIILTRIFNRKLSMNHTLCITIFSDLEKRKVYRFPMSCVTEKYRKIILKELDINLDE
ncbi:MAG: hypothetical protein VX370_04395 [Bacteroidota bacterium]|nr:hypothetical protein [Bacteroidota bacterium]